MARNISFIITNSGTINAVANGKAYTIPRDHMNYEGIKTAIKEDDVASLERLANVARTVQTFAGEKVVVRDGVMYFEGEPLHNTLTDRIFGLIRDGFPFEPMLKFLENLMENPSFHAVNELYTFLEHKGLPITEDGCFLGYKAVRSDWTDKHTGKFDNSIGKVHKVPRRTVDDNWRQDCSSGFHVGSLEYVRSFSDKDDDHIIIVKVNPADVVAVPSTESTKLRTCGYEVVAEYDRKLLMEGVHLPERVHTAQGSVVTPPSSGMGGYGYQSNNDDEDLDDDDDEFDDEDLDDDDEFDDDDDLDA